jgi:hypothetical protein
MFHILRVLKYIYKLGFDKVLSLYLAFTLYVVVRNLILSDPMLLKSGREKGILRRPIARDYISIVVLSDIRL